MSHPPDAGQPLFRLYLLGSPAVADGSGRVLPGLGPGKPLALLAYLLVAGETRREALVALLWGDITELRARNAFRQTLHRLRTVLGDEILPANRDLVRVVQERIWSDVVAFERALERGQLDEAVQLYRGEFLKGLELDTPSFSQWADEQRQRYSARWRTAIARLTDQSLARGDSPRAVELAQRLASLAPLDGNAAVLEATALVAAGRHAEAVTALTVHAQRIQTELGARPAPAVTTMLSRLLRQSERDDAIRGSELVGTGTLEAPFIGRERELAQLLAVWRRVQNGAGSTVAIQGADGIGKTRLADEFVGRARSIGTAFVFRGRESPYAATVPYASISEALRDAVDAPGIAGASQHLLAEAARLLPQLRDRFPLPEPGPITDEAERLRFFEGIAALLDAIAYEQPVILLLEDVDRGAEPTRRLLRYLSGRLRAVPVLILVTCVSARELALAGEEIQLASLSNSDARALLDAVFASDHPESAERERLVALADGVPFRLLELAERALAAEVPTAAPVTLREVMLRRLQKCTPYEQRVFVAASLFSRAMPIRLIAAAAHLSEAATLDAALALERRGLVVQRQGGIEPANATIAELAVESTGAAGTTLLAGWAADALAATREAQAAELARLYTLAQRRREAYPHARTAAWQAAASGALDEAQRFLALAASAAPSDAERAEVESLLRSFGGGRPMLVGSAQAAAAVEAAAPEKDTTATARPRPRPGRWRVRPQLLVVGAAALLLAATIRLALAERAGVRGTILADTLIVAEQIGPGETRYLAVTGDLLPEPQLTPARPPREAVRWADSLRAPWGNALTAPGARAVAVERITASGSDLYVISADRRDTTPVAIGPGDDIALGWSPDGAWLLALHGITRAGGEYDTDLYAYAVADAGRRVGIDTGAGTAVVEAAWSPRGPHIAWMARVGPERQQEVFVSDADGANVRNVSSHPAEDFRLAWSPDGERLAFTSEREGSADIFAFELASSRLRRMTVDPAPEDRPAFSPDGQFLAFESTRGGTLMVYLMPAYAGAPRAIAPAIRRLALVDWRGAAPPYADLIRVRAPAVIAPRTTTRVSAAVLASDGSDIGRSGLRWLAPDSGILVVQDTLPSDPASGSGTGAVVRGRRAGGGRLLANLGGWRSDTALVQVRTATENFRERFDDATLSGWTSVGVPPPTVVAGAGRDGSAGLSLAAAARQGSGLLSAATLTVRPGTSVRAWVRAPFVSRALAASVTVALVTADIAPRADAATRAIVPLLATEWRGDAGRVAYAADRETWTEPAAALGSAITHEFQMVVEASGQVAFYVDGRLRRRSTVRVVSAGEQRLVRLWIAGRGTEGRVVVDDVQLLSEPR